jgi:IclR family acetate operon transcriptional repressor
MMRTVDKALRLLELFSIEAPEHGLSEMARLARLDKASTLRLLVALARNGFVEQHPQTKKYRLGRNLLRLARIREASVPVASVVQPVLERLAAALGETAHAALAADRALITIGVAEPQRVMRVHVDPSEPLPLHATASGMALLAYAGDELLEQVLGAGKLTAHTSHTIVAPDRLRRHLADARKRGYAISVRGFDSDVIGIAAPVFDWSGRACATIAVASVAARLNEARKHLVAHSVMTAAIEVTRAMGGEPHESLLRSSRERAA